ncbi:CRADD protein, partial [Nyctibius bracteatus]|nr:CRADD protein [Nyctibius bracteatus]
MAGGERATLLALQRALSKEQFQTFKYLLGDTVPLAQLGPAARPDLCGLLLQRFPGRALHVAADILRQIPRNDLIRLYRLPGAEEEEEETPGTKGDNAGGSSGRHPGAEEETPGMKGDGGSSRCHPVAPSVAPRLLSEKELLQVAQRLGREWQEVGIGCLGLERSRLEQIREDNPGHAVMQSFEMLREWRRREGAHATAPRLHARLAPACLDPEVLQLLQSFQGD